MLLNNFRNSIWFTRKAWISAEKRLLSNAYHTQLLLVVYSAYMACVSVVFLSYQPLGYEKKFIETSMAVISIILFGLSLYLNSKSFKERANGFKAGYLDLHNISNEIDVFFIEKKSIENAAEDFRGIFNRYIKVLRDVENHLEIDDISGRISAGKGLTSRHLSCGEVIRYRWWRIWRWWALLVIYMAPFFVFMWFFLNERS